VKLFEWDAGGRYRVAFSTRLGGVSDGSFESLNLGILTADEPQNVVENRTGLCASVDADPEQATMAWQVHGERVTEADARGIVTPGMPYERCDGLWTDEPRHALVLVTADCFPVALARTAGSPRLTVLHVGWRGLLGGIAAEGVAAMAGNGIAAAIGPGIGHCCYEVGQEVAEPFRRRFGDDVVDGRNLDLGLATERALLEAGCATVERNGHCTSCEADLFFSHRRDRGRTGRQGVIAYIA
jgi:purine-nucleoside/S-methyl-5'-thioadenosine phosphorylase / adenosine deaminase